MVQRSWQAPLRRLYSCLRTILEYRVYHNTTLIITVTMD